jgi:large subunit ribosomal protein L28
VTVLPEEGAQRHATNPTPSLQGSEHNDAADRGVYAASLSLLPQISLNSKLVGSFTLRRPEGRAHTNRQPLGKARKWCLQQRSGLLLFYPFDRIRNRIVMARFCELTGKGPMKGSIIWRSGKPKKQGGIGTHVTAITKRRFLPNLQRVKALLPSGEVRYIRVAATALKKGLVTKAPKRTWKKPAKA